MQYLRDEPIYTLNDLAQIGVPNKREKHAYNSNPDIDINKSKDNIELVPLTEKYVKGFKLLVKDYEKEFNEKQKIVCEDRKRTFNQMLNKSQNVVADDIINLLKEILGGLDPEYKKVIVNFSRYTTVMLMAGRYMEISDIEKQKFSIEMLFNIFETDFKDESINTKINNRLDIYNYAYYLNI